MTPKERIKILARIKTNLEFALSLVDKKETSEIHLTSMEIQALSESMVDIKNLDNIKRW